MTNNWYEEGFDRIIKEMADELGLQQNVVAAVYRKISEFGLGGDYDVEKEVIWDRYYCENEKD